MSFPDQENFLGQVAGGKTAQTWLCEIHLSKYATTEISILSKNLRCITFRPDLYNFSQMKALKGLKYE